MATGSPHTVTWDYSGSPGSAVKIILLKGGIEVGTILSSTSIGSGGHGSYTWPIYWSGSTGSGNKVRIQSLSQPNVKRPATITSSSLQEQLRPQSRSHPPMEGRRGNGAKLTPSHGVMQVVQDFRKYRSPEGRNPIITLASSTPIGSGGSVSSLEDSIG